MIEFEGRQRLSVVEDSVFVDRYGRRRQVVIGAGVVLAGALVAWLALILFGVFALGFTGASSPGGPS
ncbi:MAG TPA: hypothetical protein VK453_26355 [Micromonosporaceae bacterium]|nr:hypothetical protein [Micromonosporaceae bacterium]